LTGFGVKTYCAPQPWQKRFEVIKMPYESILRLGVNPYAFGLTKVVGLLHDRSVPLGATPAGWIEPGGRAPVVL
jgi:hypothetical protein